MAPIIRIPRPMGTTQLALDYRNTNNAELLRALHNYVINIWLMSNNTLCGTPYDTNAFSLRFNIPMEEIKEFMRDKLLGSHIWDKENQEQLLNGLLGEQIMWAMEDRNEILQQVNILKIAQGGTYKPFISAELNKALKLRIESSNSLQAIVKGLTGGNTTNIFAQFNQQNNIEEPHNYLTIEEARELVMEANKSLPKSEEVKVLEESYDLDSLPVVVANDQRDIDTSKEGLNINKIELNSIADNYKGSIEVAEKEHHALRREIESGINPEDEDPELDIYEEDYEEVEPEFNLAESFLNR